LTAEGEFMRGQLNNTKTGIEELFATLIDQGILEPK
jgi:hypothetical protein